MPNSMTWSGRQIPFLGSILDHTYSWPHLFLTTPILDHTLHFMLPRSFLTYHPFLFRYGNTEELGAKVRADRSRFWELVFEHKFFGLKIVFGLKKVRLSGLASFLFLLLNTSHHYGYDFKGVGEFILYFCLMSFSLVSSDLSRYSATFY